jgi:hypothetical protein
MEIKNHHGTGWKKSVVTSILIPQPGVAEAMF